MMEEELDITDWEYSWERRQEHWKGYVGPRLREVWNSLSLDLRRRIKADFSDRAYTDWSDGIDAMGEDA